MSAITNNGWRWFWWLYSAAICAAGFARLLERLAKESGGFWSQFGPLFGTVVVAAGILGWLHKRRILNVWFWRFVHLCLVVALLLAVIYAAYIGVFGLYLPAALVFFLALLPVPASIALFRYAYRSRDLWDSG